MKSDYFLILGVIVILFFLNNKYKDDSLSIYKVICDEKDRQITLLEKRLEMVGNKDKQISSLRKELEDIKAYLNAVEELYEAKSEEQEACSREVEVARKACNEFLVVPMPYLVPDIKKQYIKTKN